ncbi:MAG TPA: IS30 family transposase [Marinilabiliales bacterium]|nr:IS30 family transposase [Marinilabiliales bacterium]
MTQTSCSHITDSDRSEISILFSKGHSRRGIARALGKSHSSIVREILRNKAKGRYEPLAAKVKARTRRKQSKYQGMKVEDCREIQEYVIANLKLHRTPEEIAGRMKWVDTHVPYVSHEAIYKWLYSAYGQRYCYLLPSQRFKPRKRRKKKTERSLIPNRVGIEQRPEAANDRSEFGHFETDTVVSGKRTGSKAALDVLVERKARYTRLRKLPNLRPKTNNRALKKMAKDLKMSTLTYDNGIENRNHEELALALRIKTYFCRPYHSWEKGTIENTNGRIRRFIPKGADLNNYSEAEIQKVEDWLNHTPRKCLAYKTPYEIMILNNRFISTSKIPTGAFEG